MFFTTLLTIIIFTANSQNKMTPELLWKLERVSGLGISKDKKYVVFSVTTPDLQENKNIRKTYMIPVTGGDKAEIKNPDSILSNNKISPDGNYIMGDEDVKMVNMSGKDFYPDLVKSNVLIYTSLSHRAWDAWEDGKFSHIYLAPYKDGKTGDKKDINEGEPYDSPAKNDTYKSDYIWSPDSKHILYVAKKKFGTQSALSYNYDLYEYDITTGATKNFTEGSKGNDSQPSYSSNRKLAWVQNKNEYKKEFNHPDKQDIVVLEGNSIINLTKHRDDIYVMDFKWSDDGKNIYFRAPLNGTLQLFDIDCSNLSGKLPAIRQITKGDFDISSVMGQSENKLIVSRTDFNHAAELYTVDIATGSMQQLTHVNDSFYSTIDLVKMERRWVTTTDKKKMLVWIIYPPGFDTNKKYPTLLYCSGGPHVPLTQSYSFRWNFQLMASQGYIVVAANRRGMPGHGTKWNDQVDKDWGGQAMLDYLSAIDALRKEKYVDNDRLGCVGASFGGFSSFALAGMHNGRFKTFIAHDGVFDFKSWFGTVDGILNWEIGGAYWDKKNAAAQRSYSQSPNNFVDKWNTPIMIIQGEKDYRVPIEQGLQAFQAAQYKGIKSKLLYLPEENHWVLTPQNGLVWQREFFSWLKETLPNAK